MLITIQEIEGPQKSSKGNWQEVALTFTKEDGSNSSKKVVSFGNSKPVFEALSTGDYGPGDTVNIVTKKNGQYWDWVDVKPASGEAAASPKASGGKSGWVPDPNRETPEERYKRNKAICRQNALTNAVNFKQEGDTVEDVLARARIFYAFTTQDFLSDADLAHELEENEKKFQ